MELDFLTTEICEHCHKAYTLRSDEGPTYFEDCPDLEGTVCRDCRSEDDGYNSTHYLLYLLNSTHDLRGPKLPPIKRGV